MLKESMKSIGSECDVVSFSPLGSKVEEESSIYEYYVTKTETQKLEDKSLYYAFIDFLSFPFFASQILPDNGMGDILFWNEPVEKHRPEVLICTNSVLDHLFEKCDISLDINYEGEIVDAVAGHVVAKTPFIGYLSQLCFSVVGIIVTVLIFVAGLGCMMYANKISKEVNQELEDENN